MLLSIIIPTKNRQAYCYDSVCSIIGNINKDCELIIHDNSDNDYLGKRIELLNNPNVKYYYCSEKISFVENFNKSLLVSTGKYFCFIGDDDSILPNIIDFVKWMENADIDSLSSTSIPDYTWINPLLNADKSGALILPYYKYGVSKIIVDERLKRLLKDGIVTYQKYLLPRTYHGIVRRECMESVKAVAGHYFGGLTPDIYSTIALSCVIKNHIVVDYPFSVAGACPQSASVANMKGQHSGIISQAPHFRNRGIYKWEEIIPQYYSVETVWAESAIKALREMDRQDLIKFFDADLFAIDAILANRYYILGHAIKMSFLKYASLRCNVSNSLHLIRKALKMAPLRTYRSIERRFGRRTGESLDDTVIENVLDIKSAVDITCDRIAESFLKVKVNLGNYEKAENEH